MCRLMPHRPEEWHPRQVDGRKAGVAGAGTALLMTVGVVIHFYTAPARTVQSPPGNSIHGAGPAIGDCVTVDGDGHLTGVVVCSQAHFGTVLATPPGRSGACPQGSTLSRRSEDGSRTICIGPDRVYAGR